MVYPSAKFFEVFMKLLVLLAALVPALAIAEGNQNLREIHGDEAVRLERALGKPFASPSIRIECGQARCRIELTEKEKSGHAYLYRSEEARDLYEALRVEEFEGRLGFTKVFADIDSGLEILCSRFRGAEGEEFSCSLDLGQ